MGNCLSSPDPRPNFAEQQRLRAAAGQYGQPSHPSHIPPNQYPTNVASSGHGMMYPPLGQRHPSAGMAGYPHPTSQAYTNPPSAFDLTPGKPLDGTHPAQTPSVGPGGAITDDPTLGLSTISGDHIGMKTGEVLIISYDLGTTACR